MTDKATFGDKEKEILAEIEEAKMVKQQQAVIVLTTEIRNRSDTPKRPYETAPTHHSTKNSNILELNKQLRDLPQGQNKEGTNLDTESTLPYSNGQDPELGSTLRLLPSQHHPHPPGRPHQGQP